ncbi:mitochondrial ATP synthase delta subunit, putative [Plasmodium ovale wallikeri]|uniref:Mitochondrial ATP synthase delta subunit, putative n=1 Tax=Plasmodium ovale wallikeri TaxID=864142 RepID=A0A1A8YW26_PLAOA|nr:mitochondrial ATP synthase delta subunit, putative [Plasmodium ovale wallikeri]SBT36306.1 mitochondrial ATP synthase delta subunit, putative [Plasmodium ovale wallikeri]
MEIFKRRLVNAKIVILTLLRNGIITVEFDEKEKKQFFISDGIFIYKRSNDNNNSNNAEIVGIEIVPLEYLDKNKTVKVLQQMCAINDATDDKWRKIKTMLGSCVPQFFELHPELKRSSHFYA